MKKLLMGVALLALPASTAFAIGIDMQWNDCIGSASIAFNKNFTCTGTVNQNYNLVMQFKPGQDLPAFVSATAILDLQDETAGPLPPFWHYEDAGCQRSGSSKGVAIFDVPIATDVVNGCAAQDDAAGGDGRMSDPWGGDGTGGAEAIAVYIPDSPVPGRARFGLLDSSAAESPLTAGRNYYLFHLQFNNKNRTACTPGCTHKVAIVFNSVTLESDKGDPAVILFTPDKGQNCGIVNSAAASTCQATPTQNTTWGQLKAMYR